MTSLSSEPIEFPNALIRREMERLRQYVTRCSTRRELYGKPSYLAAYPVSLIYNCLQWGQLGRYVSLSHRIPGWTRGAEAVALARAGQSLPDAAVIVEIGSFLGSSTILLAGARKLRRSGKVYCIDPFDASGDAFSVPIYRTIRASLGATLRQSFENNIRRAGLSEWVEVRQGCAHEVAAGWCVPIDLIFLDGDQSYEGVRVAYESWSPFLKQGGIIAVHNSRSGSYHPSHDGHMRLVVETIRPPQYDQIRCIGTTTFARKMTDPSE